MNADMNDSMRKSTYYIHIYLPPISWLYHNKAAGT